jgi:hypothetical protein
MRDAECGACDASKGLATGACSLCLVMWLFDMLSGWE